MDAEAPQQHTVCLSPAWTQPEGTHPANPPLPNLSPGAQGSALTATSLMVSHGSHQLSGLGWFILSLPLPLTVQTREREGSGKSTPSSLAANEKRKEGGLTEPPTWERPPHHLPPKGPALPEAPRGRPSLQRRPCSQGRELELVRRRLQAVHPASVCSEDGTSRPQAPGLSCPLNPV